MNQDQLLEQYYSLLSIWNKKINLVQEDTLLDCFNRHIKDSFQISEFLNRTDFIIDIGSGAGFPGAVLSINGFENVLLCEKVFKKAVFLKTLKEKLNLSFEIFNDDVYKLNVSRETLPNTVAVSRAFGSLELLIEFLDLKKIPRGVFHKGKNYKEEVEVAAEKYEFDYNIKPSITNPDSVILIIENVRRK